jgi:hypothetical protein
MPRIDGRHISMEEYEKREARDAAKDAEDAKPPAGSKVAFHALMETIRAAYAKLPENLSDAAKFDRLVQEPGVYALKTWPRHHVTNALVRVSAKAQFLNKKYYGGRYK